MKYIKKSEQYRINESNDDSQKVIDLLTTLFDKRNLRVDITEKNLDFVLNVRVPKNPTFDEILNVLEAFRSVEESMPGYESEIELWYPEFQLIMEKVEEGDYPDSRMPF